MVSEKMKKVFLLVLLVIVLAVASVDAEEKFDAILKIDGTTIPGKILRVTEKTIEIDPEGEKPFLIINRNEVWKIFYSDGSEVIITEQEKWQTEKLTEPKEIQKPAEPPSYSGEKKDISPTSFTLDVGWHSYPESEYFDTISIYGFSPSDFSGPSVSVALNRKFGDTFVCGIEGGVYQSEASRYYLDYIYYAGYYFPYRYTLDLNLSVSWGRITGKILIPLGEKSNFFVGGGLGIYSWERSGEWKEQCLTTGIITNSDKFSIDDDKIAPHILFGFDVIVSKKVRLLIQDNYSFVSINSGNILNDTLKVGGNTVSVALAFSF